MELIDLPVELLTSVASHLAPGELYRFCQSCRLCWQVAEPLLYHTYRTPEPPIKFENGHTHRKAPITPFIQRLIQHPELRVYVRRVELSHWSTASNILVDGYAPQTLSHEDFVRYFNTAKELGLIEQEMSRQVLVRRGWPLYRPKMGFLVSRDPDEGKPWQFRWLRQLHAGLEDPQILVMMFLLPRLEEISIEGNPYEGLPWRVLELAPHGFPHLRKLTVQQVHGNFMEYVPLLAAPGMQTFEAWRGDLTRFTAFNPPAKTSPVTDLFLEYFSLAPKCTMPLLNHFIGLRSFSFSRYHMRPTDEVEQTQIVQTLLAHKGTLKHLRLEGDYDWDEHHLAFDQFENLRILAVQTSVLRFAEGSPCPLPQSLKVLVLIVNNYLSEFRFEGEGGFIDSYLNRVAPVVDKLPELELIEIHVRGPAHSLAVFDDFRVQITRPVVVVRCFERQFGWRGFIDTFQRFKILIDEYGEQ